MNMRTMPLGLSQQFVVDQILAQIHAGPGDFVWVVDPNEVADASRDEEPEIHWCALKKRTGCPKAR